MRDREFLIWIHDRFVSVHGESDLKDYMHKLRAVITAIPATQETPNDGRGENDSAALQTRLTRMDALAAESWGIRMWRRFIERAYVELNPKGGKG